MRAQMPALFAEMKADLVQNPLHLDVVVLPHKRLSFRDQRQPLAYYEDEHSTLRQKFSLLEDAGYVRPINSPTPGIPMYRLTKEFVDLVRTL